MKVVSKQGLDLIKRFEGFRNKPYLCSAGVPTIGYGSTFYLDKRKVSLQDPPISEEEATKLLELVANDFAAKVIQMCSVELSQNELDALTSFAYNVGVDALKKSTLLKKLNAGDRKGAGEQFLVWNKAVGKVLPGLAKRREAERELFMKQQEVNQSTQVDSATSSEPSDIFNEVDKKLF